MVNGEKFEISYYAKKHGKFISRRGQWNDKCKYWFSKSLKPLITYFDIDANNYRTASGSYWIKLEVMMSNKHFCQGPTCHEKTTQDRFLKSRGVVRGRYAYTDMDKQANGYYYFCSSDKYFCSQGCKNEWLNTHMENIEQGRPIEFIRHRRESQGYAKVQNDNHWGSSYSIERVDNRTEIE